MPENVLGPSGLQIESKTSGYYIQSGDLETLLKMNGHILPRTSIAVDFWLTRGRQSRYVHFLSHIHGDHIVGLTSTWMQPIYCSVLTAEILHIYYGISKPLLHPLPLNQQVIINLPHLDETFSVTAFDANHCPGALMFFFQGHFGNHFYTGDFRYSSDDMSKYFQPLRGMIDTLYIDNTFCSPLCKFPSRQECLSQIINLVKQHNDHEVIIGVRKVGKEDLLVKLGLALDETIYVLPKQLSLIQYLYSTNIFTCISDAKDQHMRVRTVPFHQVTSSFIHDLNEKTPTIAILPSAIFSGLTPKPFSKNPNVYVIPYSDHSSYQELIDFVSLLKPSHIRPIVNNKRGPFGTDISDRQDMSCFKSFLNPVPLKQNPSSESESDLSCIGPGSYYEVTISGTTSMANVNTDKDVCTLSEYSRNISIRLQGSNTDTCNSISYLNLKRKSCSFSKRRKVARGVCYVDDSPKHQNGTVFVSHDYEENIEKYVPPECRVTTPSRDFHCDEINQPAPGTRDVSNLFDNKETENAHGSFNKSHKYLNTVNVKESNINICENNHSSFSYSQDEKPSCLFSKKDELQSPSEEMKIPRSFSNNIKEMQNLVANSPLLDDFPTTRQTLGEHVDDILIAFRDSRRMKKESVQRSNKFIISSLKSAIKRWETMQQLKTIDTYN